MRRLWITRHKATAACLAKMKVYIEDPENGDTMINDVPCRKLGVLKNGQQKRFDIDDEAARIFVVAGKVSRNLYNEFIRIPEGREDVFLSGRNYLKPSAGNPFRFDGVEEEEVLENRKKSGRKGMTFLIAAIIVGILAGAAIGAVLSASMLADIPETVSPKTFAVEGLQITLTDAFTEVDVNGYTACYSLGNTAVFLLREDFSLMEGFADLMVEEYGAMVLANNGLEQSTTLQQEDGLTTFAYEYTDPDSGEVYYYYCAPLKGPDAFWLMQVTTLMENAYDSIPLFRQWIRSVAFPV